MQVSGIVTKVAVSKLTLILSLFCVLLSLVIYLIFASLIGGPIRAVGIFTSLLAPAILAPPICVLLLSIARSLHRAQGDVLKSREELEVRVVERTRELRKANEQLQEEIHERRQAEEGLQESITLQQTLLANLWAGVVMVDPGTKKIELVNDSAATMLGLPPEWIIGRRCHSFLCRATDDACPVSDLGQEVDNAEQELASADGRRLPILKSVKRVTIGGREKLLECFVDITDRKKGEEERKRLEAQLLQARKMEAVGTLAGGIAHDFNNLLMGIQGYTSLMMRDLHRDHPHYEQLERIEDQVRSASDLTGQLLGFARAGRYEVRPVSINEIMRRTSAMFGRTKKELTIHEDYHESLWAVEADQGQIEQVFLHLYLNAWHAMPAGGDLYLETRNVIVGEGRGALHGVPPGNYVAFSVADTGMGLDEETRKRIFDPFFTTKEMGRGTGLGLAMVYGIIKGHNGFIDVSSEPGRGTVFSLHLPASQKEVPREKPAVPEMVQGSETILLVDDEPTVLMVSRKLLEAMGYTVNAVNSGQEAITFYEENKDSISLVILDMIMPGLSGTETFQRIMELNPAARVILSTGYSIDGEARKIMDMGCRGFIQKPFDIARLSTKIREVLDG